MRRNRQRTVSVEQLESRQLMAADIRVGAVYFEQDSGTDVLPDQFFVSFEGGAPNTQLKRLVINGDQNDRGFGLGDMIFDTVSTGFGANEAHPFKVVSLQTKNPNATVKATVEDGSSLLVLEFTNFVAGDKLIFSIDVDEVQQFDPNESNVSRINEGIDPIASGIEFQDSLLAAEFVAPHYEGVDGNSKFRNLYDPIVDPLQLSLPRDNETGHSNRTTGAGFTLKQIPKPISLAGTVWVDSNEDLKIDPNETRLPNVAIELFVLQSGNYVSTGLNTNTDSQGRYSFGTNLKLQPGTYQVRQSQPAGFYSVGATSGRLASGQLIGTPAVGNPDLITQIDLSLGDLHAMELNFAENRPSIIQGHVCVATGGMDCFGSDSTVSPQADILIELLDSAGRVVASTRSASDGSYSFANLRAGQYQLKQHNAAGLIDGGARHGSSGGTVVNPNLISQIIIGGGTTAVDYDFCDLLPAEVSGFTYLDANANGVRDTGESPLRNVLVELKDSSGQVIASTRTNDSGYYAFVGIKPGSYAITEHTPEGFVPGAATAGSLGGVTDATGDLIRSIPLGSGAKGISYNFGEMLFGSLSGYVFIDANQDCLKQESELPIAGVELVLMDGQGRVVATTVTDQSGAYRFDRLIHGSYTIRQTQPQGYLQGGQKAGSGGGNDSVTDIISEISVKPGDQLTDYNFCEILPSSIRGTVFIDLNSDCLHDANESTIAGVRVELLDQNGQVVAHTNTDAQGRYQFDGLRPGTYSIREIQPVGYFQGGQRAGSGGGDDSMADLISQIIIQSGSHLIDYNFCELLPGSISGTVFDDRDMDCLHDGDETGIAGVRVELLNPAGQVIADTLTDARGRYAFNNLAPGSYSVREIQPTGYFQGGQTAPATGGDASETDLIKAITVGSGTHITDANFCEIAPAKLSGYVYQDGSVVESAFGKVPDNLASIRDGKRSSDDKPIAKVTIRLFGQDGQPVSTAKALPGTYLGQYIETETNAQGHYQFVGLPPGIYLVLQTQPAGYIDHLDTPGSAGGKVLSTLEQVAEFRQATSGNVWSGFSNAELMDAIFDINLRPGVNSLENNFSEVAINPVTQFPPFDNPPSLYQRPVVRPELFPGGEALAFSPLVYSPLPIILGAVGASDLTWHLSIINGGTPRGERNGEEIPPEVVAENSERLEFRSWTVRGMRTSNYRYISLTAQTDDQSQAVFYIPDAVPLMGDFNGDGFDELALFLDGEWFIDVNGNGRWDEEDIWVKLGAKGDQPVVGDWDGDGKDDVGVFGRRWAGDDRALDSEPGMPDPEHFATTKRPKNVPRPREESPETLRLMQAKHEGRAREDVIDHVFRLGSGRDIAVAGQFNGDSVATIGTFRDGSWRIDTTGDGKPNETVRFGEKGDRPLVGDFIGQDGIDEIAIVRGNRVIVDSNHNGQIDVTDQVFLLESTDGTVIVGDFDGDGNDEPALFQTPEQQRTLQARKAAG